MKFAMGWRFPRKASQLIQSPIAWPALVLMACCASLVYKSTYLSYSLGFHDSTKFRALITMAVFNLLVVVLAGVAIPRLKTIHLLGVNFVFSIFVLVDVLYFRYYNYVFSLSMTGQAGGLGYVSNSIVALLKPADAVLFVDFLLYAFWMKRLPHTLNPSRIALLLWSAPLWPLLSLTNPVHTPFTSLSGVGYNPYFIHLYGGLHYHVYDAIKTAKDRILKSSTEAATSKRRAIEMAVSKPLGPNAWTGNCQGDNLIMLQVESLQQFVINLEVNGQPITPNLNRLVMENVYFDNFYHQTGLGRTSDAEFLTQTGLMSKPNAVASFEYKENNLTTLAKAFLEQNYTTSSFHGFHSDFYNRKEFHKKLGFQISHFSDFYKEGDHLGWGVSDKFFLRKSAKEILGNHTKPFYSFLITLTSHHPFKGKYVVERPIDLSSVKDEVLRDYLSSIHYTDEAIGEFVRTIESSTIGTNTAIVIYGDHNGIPYENFDSTAEFLGRPATPVEWLKLQRVPLVLCLPEKPAITKTAMAGQVDIPSTICNLFGLDSPGLGVIGTDLFAPEATGRDLVFFSTGSWITRDEVLIRDLNGAEHATIKQGTTPTGAEFGIEHREAEVKAALNLSDAICTWDLSSAIEASYIKRRQGNVPPRK